MPNKPRNGGKYRHRSNRPLAQKVLESGKVPLRSLLLLLLAAPGWAAILNVPSASYPTIQAGITAAISGVDEVVVANGTYMGPGNRDLDFSGKLITVRSQNGPGTCTIDVQGGPIPDNHRGFIFHTTETSLAIVQGFTIQGGYIEGASGGGILCDGASPSIINCHIMSCSAAPDGFGGGIACFSSSAPVIADCVISNCTSGTWQGVGGGGGMFSDTSCSPTLGGCTFSDNLCYTFGGGILCETAQITDCIFDSNYSHGSAGGIECGASAVISGCMIRGNRADYNGGGVQGDATLLNSVISGNTAVAGGGLDGNATLTGCTITGNAASFGAGGINGGTSNLTRTILWGNCAPSGTGEDGLGTMTFVCCDINPAQLSGSQNFVGPQIIADPLFCEPVACADAPTAAGNYSLQAGSPCLPSGSPCGSLIGALPEGCGGPVPTEDMTWGRLKSRFTARGSALRSSARQR